MNLSISLVVLLFSAQALAINTERVASMLKLDGEIGG